MKEQRVYETEDGQRFDTEAEALQHEHKLAVESEVRQWLASQEYNARRKTEYERVILDWEVRKISDAQQAELTVVA